MGKRIGIGQMLLWPLVALLVSCGGDTTNITNYYAPADTGGTNANLSYLEISEGGLNPQFSPATTAYTAVFIGTATVTVTPVSAAAGAAVLVNDRVVVSSSISGSIPLNYGQNAISVKVIAPDGMTTKTYIINALRVSQNAYLKSSNTDTNDQFGYSISLSGDTLALGASYEASNGTGVNDNQADNSASNSGAVYVFTRTGNTWSQQAYIKASNTEAYDQFGFSVSLSGDTLAVGAINESSSATGVNGNQTDNRASNSGAVYVFTRTGSTWSQQAYLKSSNTGTSDLFGWSVALAGDTLAVGAAGEDSNATGVNGNKADNSTSNSGAVYVFTRTGSAWSQQAYIKSSNTGTDDWFGASVALSGDTMAVGAGGEDSNATGVNGNEADNGAPDSGAVYVFTRTGNTWSEQAYLKSSNTGTSDGFGASVVLSGDTLAVGAVYEDSGTTGVNGSQADNSAPDSGAVYVFMRAGSTWSQQAYLKSSNTGTSDGFGASVALSGDALAVGARYEASNGTGVNGNQADNSAIYSGAVYVFTRTGGIWTQQSYIKASHTEAYDQFGVSVALSGDTLAVGAVYEDSGTTGVNGNEADNSAPDSGAVYVFR